MHDPATVAWDIRNPFLPRNEYGFKKPLLTIWHIDPELYGNENSCGWAQPKLTKAQGYAIRQAAEEYDNNWYFGSEEIDKSLRSEHKEYDAIRTVPPGDAFVYVAWAWWVVSYAIDKRVGKKHKKLTAKEINEILWLVMSPVDNIRTCFRHGNHYRTDDVEQFLRIVARCYLRFKRPWWQHPRWHIHHYSYQFHPWINLKRWFTIQCNYCGNRFGWSEAPVSLYMSIDGEPPSEQLVHPECYDKIETQKKMTQNMEEFLEKHNSERHNSDNVIKLRDDD